MEPVRVFHVSRQTCKGRRVAAVLVAAGSFTRMGGTHKQLLCLSGLPVIAHTIRAFQQSEHICEIVLVSRAEDIPRFSEICRKQQFDKVSMIVCGGESRQQSVSNGVHAVGESADYFAVHDGARPLIRPGAIDRVIAYAWEYGAATAAVPVKDTVKVADDDGFIVNTPERSRLWNVQTPQVFERNLFMKALEQASVNGYDFTDDCQLVEMLGHKIYLVKTDYDNIKLTTPEDIIMAQGILKARDIT